MKRVVHTMGLGNRDLATILELLARSGVRRVVDVRRYGSSARRPLHDSPTLHRALVEAGLEVCDLGALLGGDRRGGYEKYMGSAPFRRGLARLEEIAAAAPTMILCAEAKPDRCHRRFLAAALEERGWTVAHHLTTLSERRIRGELRLIRKTG